MLRNHFGRLTSGIALATLISVGSATGQTKCRGYKTLVIFGEVCMKGCSPDVECNCVYNCGDGTVIQN